MVDIVFKRRKENSKSRRMRERGEHYAAYKALCDADRAMARKLEAAFTKLSEGCTAKVARAVNGEDYGMQIKRATKRLEKRFKRSPAIDGPICIPDVAHYAAGYRKPFESVTVR
ncbi:hypothetical protein QLG07_02545 [Erwinia sp. V90_4]|uniref:transcriptional antitermination N peptide n=1 Tax=Erwinia sp. V90_4 TaxID=3044239 RepID=UPI00249E73CB|nr:hypothetical protein [Erwinia sp. V90_4]MDI3438337.1 hypothetical protein [Erwinia sp. V90_4]